MFDKNTVPQGQVTNAAFSATMMSETHVINEIRKERRIMFPARSKKQFLICVAAAFLACGVALSDAPVALAEDGTVSGNNAAPGGTPWVEVHAPDGVWQYNDTHHWQGCKQNGDLCSEGHTHLMAPHSFGEWSAYGGVGASRLEARSCICGKQELRNKNTTPENTPVKSPASVQERQSATALAIVPDTSAQATVQDTSAQKWEADFNRSKQETIALIRQALMPGSAYWRSYLYDNGLAKPIELGDNLLFDTDMLNAMRGKDGVYLLDELRFSFTYEGKRYIAIIPAGADLSYLPGGTEYTGQKNCEGILYVVKMTGGTVVEEWAYISPAAAAATGSANGSLAAAGSMKDAGNLGLATGNVLGSPVLATGNTAAPFGGRVVSVNANEYANYEAAQKALTANVQNADAGSVLAVNLGQTPTLSAKFFEAATDENGLTKTNLAFTYSVPGVSGGAVRRTVIPAGTDLSALTVAGKAEGILYVEQVSGCPGEVIQYDEDQQSGLVSGFDQDDPFMNEFAHMFMKHF